MAGQKMADPIAREVSHHHDEINFGVSMQAGFGESQRAGADHPDVR